MTAFENRLRDNGLFGEAMSNADMYRSLNLFPEGRQGRDQALVAGGLKVMSSGGHEDLLDATLAPFGMDHVGSGNPAGYRGVGNDLGPGPAVSVASGSSGGGGYAGRGGVPGPGAVVADHEVRSGALRTDAEDQAAVMVEDQAERTFETQSRLEEEQSTASSVAGWLSNYIDATTGAVRGLIGGDEAWVAHVDGYRQDALHQGLTQPQAELYAYDKSMAGMLTASPNLEYRDGLIDNVLSEYEGMPRAGHSAVKMIERAVSMTDAGARGPLGELSVQNETLPARSPAGGSGASSEGRCHDLAKLELGVSREPRHHLWGDHCRDRLQSTRRSL
jgi:hypothetical protein